MEYDSLFSLVLGEKPAVTQIVAKGKTLTVLVLLDDPRDHRIGQGVGFENDRLDTPWMGCTDQAFTKATLVFDAKKLTVLEASTAGGSKETFSGYTATAAYLPATGREETVRGYVPRNVEVEMDDARFVMKFKAYEPGLWLLDKSEYFSKKKLVSTATVRKVKVNGKAAEEFKASAQPKAEAKAEPGAAMETNP